VLGERALGSRAIHAPRASRPSPCGLCRRVSAVLSVPSGRC
jgi:hypothetical protein